MYVLISYLLCVANEHALCSPLCAPIILHDVTISVKLRFSSKIRAYCMMSTRVHTFFLYHYVARYLLLSLLPIKRRCDSIIKRVGHNHVACVVLCGQKVRSRPLPVLPRPATLPRTHLPDVSKVPITARSQITKNENVNHITNALRFYNCMKYFCFCWPFHLYLHLANMRYSF